MYTPSQTEAYDPFGDPTVRPRVPTSRRERRLAVAIFWSVALLLIAGRVYQHDLVAPQSHAIAIASR